MPESVADKTPMPITIERRHIDPPGLWIVIVIGSVAIHSLLVWLMLSSKLNTVGRSSRTGAIPIQVVEVVPRATIRAKPRIIAQKPKIEPKLQSTKPIQVKPQVKPQSLPQTPSQPATNPVQPPQNQASQPGTIAFTNNIPVKKPPNKSQRAQKERSLPPIKPKVEQKAAIIPAKVEPKKPNQKPKPDQTAEKLRLQQEAERRRLQQEALQQRQQQLAQQRQQELAQQQRLQELAQQQRQQELAQQQRLQKLAQQQRQQELAQQQRQQELAQQQRQQELAQQQRQQELAQQQRQQELEAQQQRQQELAQQQRQQELEAQQRKEEVARNQTNVPVGSPVDVAGNPTPFPTETPEAPTPTTKPTSKPRPTSTPATTTTDNTSTQGGFLIASLYIPGDEVQKGLNAGTTRLAVPPRLQETTKTPKKLPILNEQDKKLVTKPIRFGILLSIDAKGNIFSPRDGFPGIKADSDIPGTEELCQRYAEQYFKLNKENIKFIPGKDIDGIPSAGQMLINLTIQPAAPDNKNPS